MNIRRNISQLLGNPKRYFRRTIGRNLPRMLTHSDVVSVASYPLALPAEKKIFDEPYVFRPTNDDFDILSKNLFFAERKIVLPPISVYRIPNGLIFPKSGLVADEGGRFIIESGKSFSGYLKGQEDFYRMRRGTEGYLDGCFSTIHCGIQSKSLGHSTLDGLPRLYALSKLPFNVTLIQSEKTTDWNKSMLKYCLPSNLDVKFVSSNRPFQVKSVMLSPYLNNDSCALWRPEILDFMRGCFFSLVDSVPFENKKRFFVWRRNIDGMHGANRRITNERELFSMFSKYNIQPISPEKLSLPEQIELYRDAELILGVPGSGMALIFLALNAAVINIFPNGNSLKRDLHVWDWSLARSAGNYYFPVYHSYGAMVPEFEVDVDRIEQAIVKALHQLERQY